MLFVGRQRETRQVLQALCGEGRTGHLVVSGRFGSGRTRLLQHVAEVVEDGTRFVFADLSRTAGQAASQLWAELAESAGQSRPAGYTHLRVSRFRISHLPLAATSPTVLVLDDIQKITRPRLRFVSELAQDRRFGVVAVIDASVPRRGLLALRGALLAAPVLSVGKLQTAAVTDFLRHYAQRCGWEEEEIPALARTTRGYALSMVDLVLRHSGRGGLIASHGHGEIGDGGVLGLT